MGLSTGQLLARRYRLGRRIAIGGMGEVWQAADTRLDRQVAVKVLKPELSGDAEFRHRFQTEARMTASLNHPGIAAVHDYGEAPNDPDSATPGGYPEAYLVMELIDGEPLATILLRHQRLPADRTLNILEQAGEALQAAHERGLVHRDIKPGNILITPAGKVKLTDFGIARAVDAAPVTRNGMVMGTAHYIAPEQAAGNDTGPAGDVYSLGVVGYECLAGQRPFSADNTVTVAMMHIRDQPPPLPPDVPAGARGLIEATLAKDPRQRYGTGGEFAAAVAAVRAGHRLPPPSGVAGHTATAALTGVLPHQSPATALLPPPQRHVQRRGALRIAMGLLGVLVLVLGGYLAREALRPPAAPAGVASGEGPTDVVAVPTPRETSPLPFEPEPVEEEFSSEPINPRGLPLGGVLVVPTDYWGETASEAAFIAKSRGLVARVVDEEGQQVDRDWRSRCQVIRVRPLAGLVPQGSTLELTCRRFR
ncbi:MAG: serine/threonine-protein kinase [Pseudonocardiaceae bacterium]